MWSFPPGRVMRSVPVVEAKARFSALLAAVEAGEEIAITRNGRPVARLVPSSAQTAADVFRVLWTGNSYEFDVVAPDDAPPEPVPGFA